MFAISFVFYLSLKNILHIFHMLFSFLPSSSFSFWLDCVLYVCVCVVCEPVWVQCLQSPFIRRFLFKFASVFVVSVFTLRFNVVCFFWLFAWVLYFFGLCSWPGYFSCCSRALWQESHWTWTQLNVPSSSSSSSHPHSLVSWGFSS